MKRFLIFIIYMTSCCVSKQTADDSYWLKNNYSKAEIFYPEGMAACGYLIKTEEQNYQPLNLHDSLHVDRQKVWVKFHMEKQQMSVCMMGPIITIDDIQLRK